MTRCPEFYEKLERDGNFCGLSPSEISRIKAYRELIGKISTQGIDRTLAYEHFPAGAAREITSLKDDETRIKGLNYVVACLKRNEKITAGDLQKTLEGFRESSGSRSKKLPFGKNKPQPAPESAKEPQIIKPPAAQARPPLPVTSASIAAPLQVPPAPIAQTLKEKYTVGLNTVPASLNPEVKPVTTVKESLTTQPDWHCGVAPCPDGQDHIEVEKIRGKVCGLLSAQCNQLKKERCPVIIRQAKAQEQGFVPAADIDPTNGAKFVRMAPVKIVRAPVTIQFEPSMIQLDFINQALDSGKFDTPQQVLSQALDLWMDQEGGV